LKAEGMRDGKRIAAAVVLAGALCGAQAAPAHLNADERFAALEH